MLELLSGYLLSEIAPEVSSSFGQASLGVTAAMLGSLREEWDSVAERYVEENAALRGLFEEAAPAVTAAELRARLEAAAQGRDESLRVSVLERGNAALRSLLIELHAHVERSGHPYAGRIERAIWAELVAGTERRKLATDPF